MLLGFWQEAGLILLALGALVVAGSLWWLPYIYARKRDHPAAQAIGILCLLSPFTGGLLWLIAVVWASYNPAADARDKEVRAARKRRRQTGLTDAERRLMDENRRLRARLGETPRDG